MSNEQEILDIYQNITKMAERIEEERLRPFMLLRPKMFLDGNQWCALYGANIQGGVCGFGASPEEASRQFDKAWSGKMK